MTRPLLAPLALLALALGIATARAEDESKADEVPARPLLARIADEKDPGREAALAAWKALSFADRGTLARRALRSADPGLALAGAVVANPISLDLEELGLQSRALARVDPLARLLRPAPLAGVGSNRPAFGSKDLLSIWTALAERDPDPEAIGYSRFHRALLPEDVPALVPLLERAKPRVFRALLEDLSIEAADEADDANHDVYVRAFRYGLARLRAEDGKREPPRLADLPPAPRKAGIPAEFLELATGALLDAKGGFGLAGTPPQESNGLGPWPWLHRWALRLVPTEEDIPFLLSLVQGGDLYAHTRAWAARRIAALPGRAAGHAYGLVLESLDGPAAWAAAERATRGEAGDWKRLADPKGDWFSKRAGAVALARWLADPAGARATAVEEIRQGDVPKELEARERWFLEREYGVAVSDDDVRGIVAKALETPLDVWVEGRLLVDVAPEPLEAKMAARVCASWAGRPGEEEADASPVLSALARLFAAAPQETVALLRSWADSAPTEKQRVAALVVLARCGDGARAEAMTTSWAGWEWHRHLLGRVPGDAIEVFLRREAASTDPEARAEAVQALAIRYGCPERLSGYLGGSSRDDDDFPEEVWSEIDALVLAKDPVGAVLRRTVDGPLYAGTIDLAGFGRAARDPRVRERLLAWREQGTEPWHVTAALALAGDERERAEWRAFLGEARAFLLDSLLDPVLFTLDGDPETTAFWVSRLDANCCHQWHAHEALSGTYPTFPYEKSTGGGGRTRAGAERWFARHAGTFVGSPLLDGWIPGPKR